VRGRGKVFSAKSSLLNERKRKPGERKKRNINERIPMVECRKMKKYAFVEEYGGEHHFFQGKSL